MVIDRLGYDANDHPDPGQDTCLGAQADVANQIVGQLRDGSYDIEGMTPPQFGQVVLAAHSAGGLIAQVTAYSFEDIDALIVAAYADQGASNFAVSTAVAQNTVCATGGERAEGDQGPRGYAFFGQTDRDARQAHFSNASEQVVRETLRLRNRDPCGDAGSGPGDRRRPAVRPRHRGAGPAHLR